MALSTARIHRVRGRPPPLAAGIKSLIHSHSSSVRSLGYVFSFIHLFYTTHEDFSDRLVGYPKAALFAFCLALVAYNAVAVIKAALRSVHGKQQGNDDVSSYYLALEIRQTYDGMMVAIPASHWEVFRVMSPAALAAVLRELAAAVRLAKYRKHPRGPKKKPPARTAYKNGSHVATARLIAQRQ